MTSGVISDVVGIVISNDDLLGWGEFISGEVISGDVLSSDKFVSLGIEILWSGGHPGGG